MFRRRTSGRGAAPADTDRRGQAQARTVDTSAGVDQRRPRRRSSERVAPTDWTLRLESVSFSYAAEPGANGFSLREVDLEIPRGATVFIVGGNGSGKTTLAKILLGLYRPHSGRVLLDDLPLDDASVLAYRSQFCSVFSDVHLFRRALRSDPGFDDDLLRRTLGELSLPLRLDAQGRLDVRALSQGQKKRMASAFAMTDRRLCLLDEWVPTRTEFRRYFYETFLPRLREEGRTVIVITHDDRQFHRADLLVHLDAGQIVDVRRQGQGLPVTQSASLADSAA
jgi:putative ATP-binding cassette transporter